MRMRSRPATGFIPTGMRACCSARKPGHRPIGLRDPSLPTNHAVPMPTPFEFRLLATDGAARCGEMRTPHGVVATPAFMPVGTQATVKGLAPEAVRATGAEIVLANTYHLMLRPGAERVARLGGLHRFMNWPLPILTDSGGFQVMSLSELRKVEERGVTFRSHLDGAVVELSPERAIEIQYLLGADIAMQLDECIKLPAERTEVERAMRLSLRWGERSKRAFEGFERAGHALFGIIQGGDDSALRQKARADFARSASTAMQWGGWRSANLRRSCGGYIDDAVSAASRRPAAVPDGGRYTRRLDRGGGTRNRHVRLRDAARATAGTASPSRAVGRVGL